jgi:ABC-type proline/glycine betaine transport system ATPase subunit
MTWTWYSLAERVVVLYYGRLVAQGTPDEIQVDPKVREIYLGTEQEHAWLKDVHTYYGRTTSSMEFAGGQRTFVWFSSAATAWARQP